MYVEVTIAEHKFIWYRRRAWWRVALPFGFAALWPWPWPLYSKQGTFSRVISRWMGWDILV